MEAKYFLAGLLCVYLPVFGWDAWQMRNRTPLLETKWGEYLLGLSLLVSTVVSTLFNFNVSHGVGVNLSIVILTMSFFILRLPLAIGVLALYVVSELAQSVFILGHGHATWQAVHTVLIMLPKASVTIWVYLIVMAVCSLTFKFQSFAKRATGFVAGLVCYAAFDYAYIDHVHHFRAFNFVNFGVFILVFNLIFIAAMRMMLAGMDNHTRRIQQARIEKSELISQLSASVAHEIRNPITVVRGYTQLMLHSDVGREKNVQFMEIMLAELDRAESVISDFLKLAKQRMDDPDVDIPLSQVLHRVIELMEPLANGNNVELLGHVQDGLMVRGNHGLLTQSILNLVKNAIEANEELGKGRVDVYLTMEGLSAVLRIRDTGKGIPTSVLPKLGQPYYSTKTQGTGLGLTLTYKVIGDMNGKIEVQSKEGSGTTFTIRLPDVTVAPVHSTHSAQVDSASIGLG